MSDQKEFDLDSVLKAGVRVMLEKRLEAVVGTIDPAMFDEVLKERLLKHVEKMDEWVVRGLFEESVKKLFFERFEAWGPAVFERTIERFILASKRFGEFEWNELTMKAVDRVVTPIVLAETKRITTMVHEKLAKLLKEDS